MINQLVEWVRAELIERKEKMPKERELRRLIRLALRYARLGRSGLGVRDMGRDKLLASTYLANFVTLRMEKAAGRSPSHATPAVLVSKRSSNTPVRGAAVRAEVKA